MNNRQNGRRRGRGGQQARNGQPGAPDRGSRLDNRARGNAAQLLEKYKTLARDAQMQGDRVLTETYLQFADHYFRVLSESRSRFEEQQQRRPTGENFRDDFGNGEDENGYQGQGDGQGDDGWDNDGDGDRVEPQRDYQPQQQPQRREPRAYREEANGNSNAGANGNGNVSAPAPVSPSANGEREAPRRRNNANGNGANGNRAAPPTGNGNGFVNAPDFLSAEAPRIEIDRMPPAISADSQVSGEEETEAAAPKRRRPRRPREAAPVEA